MTRARRRLITLGALVAVGGGVAFLMRPRPLTVETARVAVGPLRVTIDGEGRTRVRDRYVVTAPVAGRLERLALRAGDRIARGALIARLAPLPLDGPSQAAGRARLAAAEALAREAEARIAQARPASTDAERNLARARTLEQAGGISPRELERAELALRTAQQDLAALEARSRAAAADVQAARAALLPLECENDRAATVLVRSPVAGRVLAVPEESERIVGAGAPLLEIGDADQVEVVVDVLSSDAVKIQVGATVWIEEWGGEGALRACVREIEPSAKTKVSALGVEEQRVDVLLDILDRAPRLGDRYQVEARIVLWESDSVLTIPASAVFRSDGQWQVYVVRDGRARLERIAVGHRSPAAIEILNGLRRGDQVIVFPSDEIVNGKRVVGR
jgi:HlyD family secretion protein